MNGQQLSMNGDSNLNIEEKEFNIRKKISSSCNRLIFLKNCIAEKVLARSTPKHLRNKDVPFPDSAKAYLEEACQTLREEIVLRREQCAGISLSQERKDELKKANTEQQTRLDRKLADLCRNSAWQAASNNEKVTNLS